MSTDWQYTLPPKPKWYECGKTLYGMVSGHQQMRTFVGYCHRLIGHTGTCSVNRDSGVLEPTKSGENVCE